MGGITAEDAGRLRHRLLAWYDRHRRDLPWRAPPGVRPDPWHVLVSELMLQQTTAATVAGRFDAFLGRFPTLDAMAEASVDEVMHAWQGLGYYRRARALHACARQVVAEHGGRLPSEPAALEQLPGIGTYTAKAVAAIAFDRPVVPVDGNIRRIGSRLEALDRPTVTALDDAILIFAGDERPGDVAQALMDLGRAICTPRRPRCLLCPLRGACRAHALGRPEAFPEAATPKVRPRRYGLAFVLERADEAILLRKRPQTGLLGGLHELPSSPWAGPLDLEAAFAHAPAAAEWHLHPERVRHVFTHFELELRVAEGRTEAAVAADAAGFWCRPDHLHRLALPTLMLKVLHLTGRAVPPPPRAGRRSG